MQKHMVFEGENDSRVDYYVLAPGISLLFNRIYTNIWEKGDLLTSGRKKAFTSTKCQKQYMTL